MYTCTYIKTTHYCFQIIIIELLFSLVHRYVRPSTLIQANNFLYIIISDVNTRQMLEQDMFETMVSPGKRLYLCKVCGKTVANRWHHYRFHNPEYFMCTICQSVHNRKDHLKAHMKTKHNIIKSM